MIGEAIAFGNVLLSMNFAREREIFGLGDLQLPVLYDVVDPEMKAGKFRLGKPQLEKTFNCQLLGSGFLKKYIYIKIKNYFGMCQFF
jgi:hypothetical protein